MPEMLRITSAYPSRGRLSLVATLALVPIAVPAWAADAFAVTGLGPHEIAALAVTLGVLLFAVTATVMLIRARAAAAESKLRDEIGALKAEIDRANALLLSEPQILICWSADGGEPALMGDPTILAPAALEQAPAFGEWLEPEKAQALQHAVAALRERGEGFSLALMTLSGRAIEAEGRAVGGSAVLRLRDVSGVRRELAEMNARYERFARKMQSLQTLIDKLPSPVWTRDAAGALTFVNAAYANAVEARDAADAIQRGVELLDRAAREEAGRTRATGKAYARRIPVIVGGQRRIFDVLDAPTPNGSAGLGVDTTEVEVLRGELARLSEAHRRTFDQLTTGVAIFTADHKLIFYNAAYRALWDLDAGFLDQGPTDSAILDRLRAARKLPEEQDFRQWKSALHQAYHATEAKEHLWYLPDGRALRVVATPNPLGGVAYLFDDVTERFALARRHDALVRVQSETLDHLTEAITVFGSDGRLRLHNPAFTDMWRLDAAALASRPHIEMVIGSCRALYEDDVFWRALHAAVTAVDERTQVSRRLERKDGSVVDVSSVPLTDGATLIVFRDVTDSVNVERALRERNEALEAADVLKINFVHHVSYELRSPLTNIIGFAHFLRDSRTGPLTEKQKEYLGYITSSTNALLAIINDILDLATIDAGAMSLNLGVVDIRSTMQAAAEGVKDRLMRDGIVLDIKAAPDIGTFIADERRVRQILYNLLSNAVGFSPPGETVTLAAERRNDAIVFSVRDHGPGIPHEMKERIFKWFETHSLGSRHRGAGLGLSIVRSFVELHGGTISLESVVGQGTTVVCSFPIERVTTRSAA